MERNRKQLSQAEVWDDSALLQSWDDALTEYKVFLYLVTSPVLAHTRYSFIIVYMRAVSESKISLRRMEFRKKIQI